MYRGNRRKTGEPRCGPCKLEFPAPLQTDPTKVLISDSQNTRPSKNSTAYISIWAFSRPNMPDQATINTAVQDTYAYQRNWSVGPSGWISYSGNSAFGPKFSIVTDSEFLVSQRISAWPTVHSTLSSVLLRMPIFLASPRIPAWVVVHSTLSSVL